MRSREEGDWRGWILKGRRGDSDDKGGAARWQDMLGTRKTLWKASTKSLRSGLISFKIWNHRA